MKILAQAHEELIPVILTEDANTLYRLAARLRERHATAVQVLLLTEGLHRDGLLRPLKASLGSVRT